MVPSILKYVVFVVSICVIRVSLTCSFQIPCSNNNNVAVASNTVHRRRRMGQSHKSTLFLQQNVLVVAGVVVTEQLNCDRRKRCLSFAMTNDDGDSSGNVESPNAPESPSTNTVTTTATITATTPAVAAAMATPQFDGKRVLPYKIIMNGLKGNNEQKVAAVYAIYNSNYQRGTDGWDTTTYVGVTQDVQSTLQTLYMNDATELKVTHCRILSFTFPQPNAMQEIANQWRQSAISAKAQLENTWADDVLNYMFEDDDDEDDDDDDFYDLEMMGDAMAIASSGGTTIGNVSPSTIISPFASIETDTAMEQSESTTALLQFNMANVDTVLNEVRPYLIADGGNVEVLSVDDVEKKVYLQLQGACGSCPSSTITMQMGIERILREKFPSLTEVIKVDDNSSNAPKELSDYEALVDTEIQRIRPAITAMGGQIQIQSVNHETGIVQIEFRGSKKVQQGVELAILDIDFVNEVQFLD